MVVDPNLAGQGNADPENEFAVWNFQQNVMEDFGGHVVVKIDGYNAVFDPSYGELYTGTSMDAAERAWEDKALAGGGGWRWRYFEADQNGNTKDANGNKIFQNGPVKPHQPDRPAGQRETRFSS